MNFGITLSNRGIPVGLCSARDLLALADAKKLLDLYYSADYTKARLEAWLTYGSPRECVEHIKRFKALGGRRISFRISTVGDPMARFQRLVEDVVAIRD